MSDMLTGLRVELSALRSTLRKIEWVEIPPNKDVKMCPYCKRFKNIGHAKSCALDEVINGLHKDAGKFWLTGRIRGISGPGPLWEIIGIFLNESMADLACCSTNHFISPVPVNELFKPATEPWPGAPDVRFPRAGESNEEEN